MGTRRSATIRPVLRGDRSVLVRPHGRDQAEFLAAVARSAELHRGWVAPPSNTDAFVAYVRRLRRRDQFGFLVRDATSHSLVGVININNVVFGAFHCGCLGYYGFVPHT